MSRFLEGVRVFLDMLTFEMPLKHPSEDIKKPEEYISLESLAMSLAKPDIKMGWKPTMLDEIT